jgi:hypothetical protein
VKGAVVAFVGCLGVLVLAVAALILLAVVGPSLVPVAGRPTPEPPVIPGQAPPPGPGPRPTPDPDAYLSSVGSVNFFDRAEDATGYRLTYRFLDYGGRERTVSCRIERAAWRKAVEDYGLTPARWSEVNRRLKEAMEEEARRRGLDRYFTIRTSGRGTWEARWEVPGGGEPGEQERLIRECNALLAHYKRGFQERSDEVQSEVLRQWGARVRKSTIEIDYTAVVEHAAGPLDDCARALADEARGGTLRQALGIMLAFYQELRYQVPPDEGGKDVMGLWVPPDVLVRAAGDCDSKSVALCASWRHLPSRSIVVLVPGHALVGVEATPAPGERFVRLGNRYFVLAEPAGPGKYRPGATTMKGDFEYVMFEPLPGAALP